MRLRSGQDASPHLRLRWKTPFAHLSLSLLTCEAATATRALPVPRDTAGSEETTGPKAV